MAVRLKQDTYTPRRKLTYKKTLEAIAIHSRGLTVALGTQRQEQGAELDPQEDLR